MQGYKKPEIRLEDLDDDYDKSDLNRLDVGPQYKLEENVYFAFLDVLGFKKIVDEERDFWYRNRNDIEKSKKIIEAQAREPLIHKYKCVFEKYFGFIDKFLKEYKNKHEFYTGQVSDSLFFYTDKLEILYKYIEVFLMFNLYAMQSDVFFRGGIAKGNLYYDVNQRNQFFGESVSCAYLLESDVAKNPGIVVDCRTYEDLKGTYLDEIKNFFNSKGNDGRHRLDLFCFLHNDGGGLIPYYETLGDISREKILKVIEKNMEKNEFFCNTYNKYRYLYDEIVEIK